MSLEILVKTYYKDDVRALGYVKTNSTLKSLRKKIKRDYNNVLDIKYKDKDGDMIAIKKPAHFKEALKEAAQSDGVLRLFLSDKPNSLSMTEMAVLESVVTAVVVIDKRGEIIFFNRAAEVMFGYGRKEVVGENVRMLMTASDAADHDEYLENYLRTGKKHVIGAGREVIAQRKDGATFAIHLSVSENKAENHHTFCATIAEVMKVSPSGGGGEGGSAASRRHAGFLLMENILDVAIVINEQGIVQFFNKKAEELFGYTKAEVIGRNVKMLMPSPFYENHDQYIQNYLTTGVPKVIGSGRDVLCQLKDGSLVPVNLSLTEGQKSDGLRMFTGILRKTEQAACLEKSILQQEREVLDHLLVPAVVIDETGAIHAFNQPCQQLFGYSLIEVVGKNVSLLMPAPDSHRHNTYLANYVKTGKAKVIGTGRQVVGLHKDGSMISMHLSVTERADGDRRIFTGVLQKLRN